MVMDRQRSERGGQGLYFKDRKGVASTLSFSNVASFVGVKNKTKGRVDNFSKEIINLEHKKGVNIS